MVSTPVFVGLISAIGFLAEAGLGYRIADRYDDTRLVATIGGWMGILASALFLPMTVTAFGFEPTGSDGNVIMGVLLAGTVLTMILLPGYGPAETP